MKFNRRKVLIAVVVLAVLAALAILALQYLGDRDDEERYLNSDEITNSTLERGGAKDDVLLGLGRQACHVAGVPHRELPTGEDGQPVSHAVAFSEHYLQLRLSDEEAAAVWVAATRELCPER